MSTLLFRTLVSITKKDFYIKVSPILLKKWLWVKVFVLLRLSKMLCYFTFNVLFLNHENRCIFSTFILCPSLIKKALYGSFKYAYNVFVYSTIRYSKFIHSKQYGSSINPTTYMLFSYSYYYTLLYSLKNTHFSQHVNNKGIDCAF